MFLVLNIDINKQGVIASVMRKWGGGAGGVGGVNHANNGYIDP